MKITPCPFCGEEELLEIGTLSTDREGTPTYIRCMQCGMQGPWKYTNVNDWTFDDIEYIAAITRWNKRL